MCRTGTKKPVAFSICLGVMAVTMTISLFGGLYLLGEYLFVQHTGTEHLALQLQDEVCITG